MKKIAITISHLDQGGIPTAFCSLINELHKRDDIDLTVFIFTKVNTSRFILPDDVTKIYPSKALNMWWGGSVKNDFINKGIHYIGIRTNYYPWIWFARYGKVYGNYDVAISYENDIARPYIDFMCNDFVLNRIKAVCKISWIHNDPYKLGFDKDYVLNRYRDFDGIVSVSKGNKQKLDTICPDYTNKSYYVYNCINLSEKMISKTKFHDIDGKFHIISVSRLANKQKRIDRMIDTCVLLKKHGYENKIVWHMYGSGPDETMLKKYAEEEEVTDIFRFEGYTDNPALLMAQSDLYVMTSDYEGYSLTLLEALCQDIPIICTNFDEAKESVVDGKNGIIVDFEPQYIESAITRLIDNKTILEEMKQYIKNHPVNNDLAIKQFMNVINECEGRRTTTDVR
jgi:glycosyltransferase involved in cell wall biosynthesis